MRRPSQTAADPAAPVRAAQYLRMSTDQQRYSLENQAAALAAYAVAHNYQIVRTYQDAGVSGRTAKARRGLQALLADVIGGAADFGAVLVYDVSRWGRFANADESAHYEFACRQEGVQVIYCAEAFDGLDPASQAVVKQLKRVMAAEYSRHLGANVRAAHRRGAAEGFWMAGEPGYGLRRAMIDDQGRQVAVLAPGDRKPVQGQRTRLVLGPAQEVAVVREIYRLFLEEDLSRAEIVRRLNTGDVPHLKGATWTFQKVHHVLTGAAYAGDQVFGRTARPAPEASAEPTAACNWVVVADVLEPCVSREDQARARAKIAGAMQLLTEAQMLARLSELLRRRGRLSSAIIKAAEGLPCPATYINRFGSLRVAYARVGYVPASPRAGASQSADPNP